MQSICSRSGAPTVALAGGLQWLPRRRFVDPICSRSGAPTAGLPGGLPLRRWRRSTHPSCDHAVAPTAGLPGGLLWLQMSTRVHHIRSHFGAAIAAVPGGLRQLLQHIVFLPRSRSGICRCHLHLSPRMGVPGTTSLLPGRLQRLQVSLCCGLKVPAGNVSAWIHLQALWPVTLLHECSHLSWRFHGSKQLAMAGLVPVSFSRKCHTSPSRMLPCLQAVRSGRTRSECDRRPSDWHLRAQLQWRLTTGPDSRTLEPISLTICMYSPLHCSNHLTRASCQTGHHQATVHFTAI